MANQATTTAAVEAQGTASGQTPAVDPAATLRDLLDRLRAAPGDSPALPKASIDASLSLCFEVQAHLHKLQLAGAGGVEPAAGAPPPAAGPAPICTTACAPDCGICTSGSDSESSSASTNTKGNRPSAKARARLRRAQQQQLQEQQAQPPSQAQQQYGGGAPMPQWQEWQWQWRDPMQSTVPFSQEQVAAMEQQFRSSLWSGGWQMAPMAMVSAGMPPPPLQPQPPPIQSVYVSEQHQQNNVMQQMWTGGWHMMPSGQQSMSTVREEGEHAPSEEPTSEPAVEVGEGAPVPTDSAC